MSAPLKTAVLMTDSESESQARLIAQSLELPVAKSLNREFDLYVQCSTQRISLKLSGKDTGAVSIDFSSGAAAHRRKIGGGNHQTLARAVGLNKRKNLNVTDATGGFARDAFVLASLGARLIVIEQSPLLCLLIESALENALQDKEVTAIAQRMSLIRGNAEKILPAMHSSHRPDVIYMDPMYPSRQKSAAVKKEMQLLHRLIGTDGDASHLLYTAINHAKQRVVVKRPIKAPPLSTDRLTGEVCSKNTRYDIYAPVT